MDQFSAEQETIVRNVNLAIKFSNQDYNHGAITTDDLLSINKVLLLLNEHGDPHFYFKI